MPSQNYVDFNVLILYNFVRNAEHFICQNDKYQALQQSFQHCCLKSPLKHTSTHAIIKNTIKFVQPQLTELKEEVIYIKIWTVCFSREFTWLSLPCLAHPGLCDWFRV